MIDVIVPVYKGLAQTRRCIDSVLANRQLTPMQVVVADDASPDPAITRYLDELEVAGRIVLIRNERNLGFIHSVNRGMSLHPDRDVVLLNSDTEVANDWLDRLSASAQAAPDIATVTPFSNNATICSYPFEGWAGGLPGTLGLGALDRIFASSNAHRTVDLPTAVGFCMFIRRASLDELGLFDAERFGRGYGEENDFCRRAVGAGWRNVLAGNVFIFHEGSVSFSEERSSLLPAAMEALLAAHPDYLEKVREFVIADPMAELRSAVDNARLTFGVDEARHVLAERSEERSRLRARLWDTEQLAADRHALIGRLEQGLANATALVAERDQSIVALEQEIARLRAGLQYAESLAFTRLQELDRIQALWVWKYVKYLLPAE